MLRFLFGRTKPTHRCDNKNSNGRKVRPILELLEDRLAPARVDYAGMSMDASNWNDPMNWSGWAVPTSADDVWIANVATLWPPPQTGLLHVPGGVSVHSLNLNGSSVKLDLQGTVSVHDVVLDAGRFQGTGTLAVSGRFDWYQGELGGTATTEILGGAEMRLLDSGAEPWSHSIGDAHTLLIEGEGVLSDTSFDGLEFVSGNPTLTNHGEFAIYGHGGLRGPASFNQATSFTFSNYGTVRLTAGAEAEQYPDAAFETISFTNLGRIEVNQGMLWLAVTGQGTGPNALGGSSSINIGGEGSLTFATGTFYQYGTTSGAGELSFCDSADVTFYTPCQVAAIAITDWARAGFQEAAQADRFILADHARLDGPGDVTVAQQFSWLGGVMSGGGDTSVLGALNIAGSDLKRLYDRDLWIGSQEGSAAEASWSGDADIAILVRGSIHNFGTFTIQNDREMYPESTDTVFDFYNAARAVLRKSVPYTADQPIARDQGTCVTSLEEVAFTNTGTIQLQSGSLFLSGTGGLSGEVQIGERETLELGHGTFTLNGNPVFAGVAEGTAGTLRIGDDACVVNIASDTTIPRIEFCRGLITGPGTLAVTDYFNWQGGDMGGSGKTKITSSGVLHFNLLSATPKNIDQRYLDNFGRVSYSGHYLVTRRDGFQDYDNPWVGDGKLLHYLNVADSAWPDFVAALSAAWNDLQQAEATAENTYENAVSTYTSLHFLQLQTFDSDYDAAMNAAQQQTDEELYWDQVEAAETDYDDKRQALMMGPMAGYSGYVPTEQQQYQQWRSAVDSARTDYRTAVTAAYNNLTAALSGSATFPGHGDIAAKAADIHTLLLDPNLHPLIIPFLQELTPDARAALSVAYKRIYDTELGPYGGPDNGEIWSRLSYDPDLRNRTTLFHGVPVLPGTASEEWSRNQNSTQVNGGTVDSWGASVAGFFQSVGNSLANGVVTAADGIRDGAVAAWRETTGFARDVVYLARNDPAALASAVGEGLRDGAVITANAFTFDAIPSLSQEAQRLVDENGGLYRVAAFSAGLSRELIVTSLTIGSAAVAQGSRVGFVASRLADHPRIVCAVTSASRAYQPIAAYYHVTGTLQAGAETMAALNRGDYGMAGLHMVDTALNVMGASASLRESRRLGQALVQSAQSGRVDALRNYLTNCFAAGTPILGEHGARAIEEYKVGDKVWARRDDDPRAPLALKPIEECFVGECPVWHVHVNSELHGTSPQVIRTTDEHPFWVEGKGWTAARELLPGDRILGRAGESATVEEVYATGVRETVYNFRVAEYHTYFVGGDEWGFALWAHNMCLRPMDRRDANWNPRPAATNGGVTLYGAAQNTTGAITNPHALQIMEEVNRRSAGLAADSYITMNRSVRTALGGLTVPGAQGANWRPDFIIVQRIGRGRNVRWRVSVYEVQSPGETEAQLMAKINVMMDALPQNVIRGEGKVILQAL